MSLGVGEILFVVVWERERRTMTMLNEFKYSPG